MQYGDFYITAGVHGKLTHNPLFAMDVMDALGRYFEGDWGDVCKEDWQQNDEAAAGEDRTLAAYPTCEGKIWIITEWDRSATTVLFPDEY